MKYHRTMFCSYNIHSARMLDWWRENGYSNNNNNDKNATQIDVWDNKCTKPARWRLPPDIMTYELFSDLLSTLVSMASWHSFSRVSSSVILLRTQSIVRLSTASWLACRCPDVSPCTSASSNEISTSFRSVLKRRK